MKPSNLQGNRNIRERPITFALALIYPELWRKYLRACLRENRSRQHD